MISKKSLEQQISIDEVFLSFVDVIYKVKLPDDLNIAFEKAMSALGINFWAYQSGKDYRSDGKEPVLFHNYPREFEENYVRKRYDQIDPVVESSEGARKAFIWGERVKKICLTAEQKKFFIEASDFQLEEGIAFPIIKNGLLAGTISLVPNIASKDMSLFFDSYKEKLHAISMLYFSRLTQLMQNPYERAAPLLTKRELQCIELIVLGKTDREIAEIFSLEEGRNISQETVKKHVNNIKKKMGVYERTHLVTTVLAQGIVGY